MALDRAGERIEEGRLPAAGATGDQQVRADLNAGPQKGRSLDRKRAEPDQVVQRIRTRRELTNPEPRAIHRDWRQNYGQPRAIHQPDFGHRLAEIERPANAREERRDGAQEVVLVVKAVVGHQDPALAFDIDRIRGVDHDFGQARFAHELLYELEGRRHLRGDRPRGRRRSHDHGISVTERATTVYPPNGL